MRPKRCHDDVWTGFCQFACAKRLKFCSDQGAEEYLLHNHNIGLLDSDKQCAKSGGAGKVIVGEVVYFDTHVAASLSRNKNKILGVPGRVRITTQGGSLNKQTFYG